MSIDEKRLFDFRSLKLDGESCFLSRLIDVFLTSTTEHLMELEGALRVGCPETIRSSADSLRVGSGIVGAGRLAELSREVGRRGGQGDVELAASHFPELRAEFDQVRQQLCCLRLSNP